MLAAHFREHSENHYSRMNCMVCRGYLNKAVILWKKLETRCPRDALSLIKVEYAPHPRPGSKPGAQAQRRSFPLLAGREYPWCGPGQICNLSVLVSGQEGASWAWRGHIHEGSAWSSGPPSKDQARGSLSVTPRPQHRSIPCWPLSRTNPV